MLRRTRTTASRTGAVQASTVFAVTLAILAGLVFAWVFKVVVLDRKAAKPPPPPVYRLTVAAVNLMNKRQIQAAHVKTQTMDEATYNAIMNDPRNRNRVMLKGNQPVGRTTVKMVRAEEPIFEDMLEPFTYPKSVAELLAPGKQAVIVRTSAKETMVQVGDRVDVKGVLTAESELRPTGGETKAATLASDVRVVARFGSTRTAVEPPPGPTREYTLEVSPYRAAIIELAKNVGAKISLIPRHRTEEDDRLLAASSDSAPIEEPPADRVGTADLMAIFGIVPPKAPPPPWRVQRLTGVNHAGQFVFPGFHNPPPVSTPAAKAGPAKGGIAPASGTPTSKNNPAAPASSPSGTGTGVAASKKNAPASGVFNPTTAVASRAYTGGITFRAPGPKPKKPGECIGCKKNKK